VQKNTFSQSHPFAIARAAHTAVHLRHAHPTQARTVTAWFLMRAANGFNHTFDINICRLN